MLMRTCPRCKRKIALNARYCRYCGIRLAPRSHLDRAPQPAKRSVLLDGAFLLVIILIWVLLLGIIFISTGGNSRGASLAASSVPARNLPMRTTILPLIPEPNPASAGLRRYTALQQSIEIWVPKQWEEERAFNKAFSRFLNDMGIENFRLLFTFADTGKTGISIILQRNFTESDQKIWGTLRRQAQIEQPGYYDQNGEPVRIRLAQIGRNQAAISGIAYRREAYLGLIELNHNSTLVDFICVSKDPVTARKLQEDIFRALQYVRFY